MNRIDIRRLRALIHGRHYRSDVGVVASISGGWFPKVAR